MASIYRCTNELLIDSKVVSIVANMSFIGRFLVDIAILEDVHHVVEVRILHGCDAHAVINNVPHWCFLIIIPEHF